MSDPIDEVKADVKTFMTEVLQRAFRIGGCDPACHCCHEKINIGDTFKLAEMELPDKERSDEMLCDNCTPYKFKRKLLREFRDTSHLRPRSASNPGGFGFSRPHIPAPSEDKNRRIHKICGFD